MYQGNQKNGNNGKNNRNQVGQEKLKSDWGRVGSCSRVSGCLQFHKAIVAGCNKGRSQGLLTGCAEVQTAFIGHGGLVAQ
jgi:hypothetical protein